MFYSMSFLKCSISYDLIYLTLERSFYHTGDSERTHLKIRGVNNSEAFKASLKLMMISMLMLAGTATERHW